jgi:BirA family biotin operon repressor/biotin-[acetyl-CoA-carboxylase] ligase
MFQILHYDTIGSTNDEARRLAAEGAVHGTVVHADQQTAGRGRLQRTWVSPPGNLYISVVLRLEVPPGRLPDLSFVTALAVADTVDALLPKSVRAMLKWPNDVLVRGAKIAGILLEQAGDATVIGIGLDVLRAPDAKGWLTTSIAASGGIASVDGARDILLSRLSHYLTSWQTQGFAPIRDAWLERAHPIGATLRVTVQGEGMEGAFGGLDDAGALLLDTRQGRQRIVAGDVAVR